MELIQSTWDCDENAVAKGLSSGKGFADVVYLPKCERNVPALVVDVKRDQSAGGAIARIKEKGYADWVKGHTGDILLVGINYCKETKEHQYRILHQYIIQVKLYTRE